jgi:ATP-binding cassette subfamily B protein
VFTVSQRIASVRACDLILVLDDGRLVAQGTHEELLASSQIYREIDESQRN